MKCPKCGYLGFDDVERCRNCGYDFSLAAGPLPELTLHTRPAEDIESPADFSFLAEPSRAVAAGSTPKDLPLFAAEPFDAAAVDDSPLITKASPPRTPLAVRRATPEVPRLRTETRAQPYDLSFDLEPGTGTTITRPASTATFEGPPAIESGRRLPAWRQPREAASASVSDQPDAGVIRRVLAVGLDLLILALVDAFVVYFTMQICGLSWSELSILPKAPMLAFLLVQNGGYFVVFTAGGQTLGKMAAGIRVVTADASEPMSVGRAAMRTLIWTLLALPAGLGFVTALAGPEHRALHDRFARTRVVRVSA